MYSLNREEQKLISGIEKSYYMLPMLTALNALIAPKSNVKKAWKDAFDQIHNIFRSTENEVRSIVEKRKAAGKISDVAQAIKSVAGNAFSNAVIYTFLKNKMIGNIKSDVFVTNKLSQIKGFEKISTIYVDGETQKPDCDLVIFTKTVEGNACKCMILSLKTSLRERAGQTYKWKILLEIATSENSIKEKYGISYGMDEMPLIGFATVNFYDEINSPQHRGMFKFFDKSFIAKPEGTDLVSPLSHLVDFVNEAL